MYNKIINLKTQTKENITHNKDFNNKYRDEQNNKKEKI